MMTKPDQELRVFLRKRIYAYRTAHHFSQEDMAEKLGITTRGYCKQEHGEIGFSALSAVRFLFILEPEEKQTFFQELRACLQEPEEAE